MVLERMIAGMIDTIKQNMTTLGENHDLTHLTPELAKAATKVMLDALSLGGVAGYQALLESYEVRERSIEVNGEEYRLKRAVEKEYLTPFGPMKVSRNLYQNASDTKSHIPLESAWGMTGEFMTTEVQEAALYSSAFMTPEEACKQFKKWALFNPSATAMKNVIAEKGRLIAEHKEELDVAIRKEEKAHEGTRALVASMDGTNVLLNEKGVKRGRPYERSLVFSESELLSSQPCLGTANDNNSDSETRHMIERSTGKQGGVSPTVYKNAMVGSVSYYGAVPKGKKSPKRLACHYTSHMPEDRALTFKQQFEAEVKDAQSHCGPDVIKVLLLDGARHLWKYADATPLFNKYEKLIDYWHTLEHLSAAAEALFGKDNSVEKLWYDTYRTKLRENDRGAEQIIRSIDHHAKNQKLSTARQKELKKQRTFFLRNKHRMNYAEFRRRGLPIGSGPVEAACKTLVKTRMCRSGMRWTRQGGEHILDIRTYVKSDRWDSAWPKIEKLSRAA
jgi:hypothetical protein